MADHKFMPEDDEPDDVLNDEVEARPQTLPEFAWRTRESGGVRVDSLMPGTKIRVQTLNSVYWLTVLDGWHRHVLVQGGILPEIAEARVEGATNGGSAIHVGWIEVNRCLELVTGSQRITTSRVREITIERPAWPTIDRAA
jgi:hypothetical protein